MTYSGNFFRTLIFVFISFVISETAIAQAPVKPSDTLEKPVFIITPRFNSSGHFPFTGSLLNSNVNFDLNIFYEHKRNGFFLFKSFDLVDAHSGVNYFQPGIFRKFEFSSKFQMRAFFGYLFSQTTGFRDKDSDYYTAATAYWTIHPSLKVENTALFFDLTQSGKLANRLLISYLWKGFKFDLFVWHRWELLNEFHATSASFSVNVPKIKISEKLYIQNTVSYQGYLSTTKPDWAMQKGLLISVAFPISVSN